MLKIAENCDKVKIKNIKIKKIKDQLLQYQEYLLLTAFLNCFVIFYHQSQQFYVQLSSSYEQFPRIILIYLKIISLYLKFY